MESLKMIFKIVCMNVLLLGFLFNTNPGSLFTQPSDIYLPPSLKSAGVPRSPPWSSLD